MKVRHDEGVANHIGPEPCVAVRKDVDEASVGEGQPLSHEIRNSGGRRCFEGGRQHSQARNRKAWRPGGVEEPGMCRSSLGGNREIPGLAIRECAGPHWDNDARTWEVRLRHSSEEADEQSRATGRGAGGAKGGGRGECRPAKHVPGTEPGKRVTGAGTHTARHRATDGV